jgi:hypothetical protein
MLLDIAQLANALNKRRRVLLNALAEEINQVVLHKKA